METIKWVANQMAQTSDEHLAVMALDEVRKAKAFHESFPMYTVTPLAALGALAKHYGLGGIYIKDESYRFGLNAFKVLGGSFAMARYIAGEMEEDVAKFNYERLTAKALREQFGQATFFTATDGNHGRGVAWAANQLGQKAVVYMPKGSKQVRLANIQKEGATATIESVNYDECVRIAAAEAAKIPRGVVIQDTAWEGYEQIPAWIMQGYGTMAMEAAEQLEQRPTHILVQAGVGSLAGAVQGYFANLYPENPPIVVIVEASEANCLYRSALAGDGEIRVVEGEMPTIMAGLACGEPNTIAWDILRNHSQFFVSCPDWVAAKGMRILGAPLAADPRVISGESGAVGMGLLATLMEDEKMQTLKETLQLDEQSVVLMFSTEGDTDPEHYREVVWDGKYQSNLSSK
ncbi:MAG: diaminopropionate ammonia-lyase [Cellulosilyticaceae bacterium]